MSDAVTIEYKQDNRPIEYVQVVNSADNGFCKLRASRPQNGHFYFYGNRSVTVKIEDAIEFLEAALKLAKQQ